MLRNKKNILLAVLGCFAVSLGAQNTDSPYSRYGYGVLNNQSIGAAKSMGGISYGIRQGSSVNPGNPASYSHTDSLTFMFDIGVNYSSGKLSDGINSQREHNGGLDYIAMQMPLSRKLGLSFGILPFSSVGYDFGSKEESGTIGYQKNFSGSGGFSQVYGGLGYEPIKGLSLGVNVGYLFGNLKYSRNASDIAVDSHISNQKVSISSVKFDLGLQYQMKLTKNDQLTLGAVFSPKMNSNGKFLDTKTIFDTQGNYLKTDTVGENNKTDMGLPLTFGFGFTLAHKRNLVVGADVTYQQWSKIKYTDSTNDGMEATENRFNDTWKFNAGAEYSIDPMDRSYFKRIRFRGGVNYSESYINVKNSVSGIGGYKEYGVTFGIGLPIRDTYTSKTSFINIGFEYLNLRPNISNMIKEQYLGVSLGVNINDLWFLKNKFK